MTRVYTEARDACFEELFDLAARDKDVVLLTVDTGAFAFKRFRQELPDQFFNVGIAEQNTMSVAAGLALGGGRDLPSPDGLDRAAESRHSTATPGSRCRRTPPPK